MPKRGEVRRRSAAEQSLPSTHDLRRQQASACPVRTWLSSRWPLPATPAMPRISPAWRSRIDIARAAGCQASSRAGTPSQAEHRTGAETRAAPGARLRMSPSTISRPTISRASIFWSQSAVFSVATFRPPRSTVMRSEISSTSSSLWLMKMTALPRATKSRSALNSSRASAGVSTAVGSSRISTRALRASTRRISTRCCSPAERSLTRAPGRPRG